MNLLSIVLSMALVTYIPRLLPMVLLQGVELPLYLKRFMKLIPYAALGALTFPGVFHAAGPDHLAAAIAGLSVALLLAWLETNLVFVVAGGIAGTLLMNVFFYQP